MLPLSFSPLYLVLVGLAAGLGMVVWSVRRVPRVAIREAAAWSSIAELAPGRFRLTGRVVPIRTTASEVDGAPCVYVERARYAPLGGGLLPLLREIAHAHAAHAFYLDDGSGRILIDPAATLIECATTTGDGGLLAERRLRAGEEIEIVACFRSSDGARREPEAGPYRDAPAGFEAGPDDVGPPRISYRTLEGMERSRIDEATGFLRGAGALTIAISLFFGAFALWMHWYAVVIPDALQ